MILIRSPFRHWPHALCAVVISSLILGAVQGNLFTADILLAWFLVLVAQVLVWRLDQKAAKMNEGTAAMVRLAATPIRLIFMLTAAAIVLLKGEVNFLAFLTSMVVGNLFYLATEIANLIRENP